MASISSIGIGSNLDVSSLLTQLMAAERKAPTARLDSASTLNESRISVLGTVKSALADLQTASKTLSRTTTFQTRTASVGNGDALAVTASRLAQPGSYAVKVDQLAQTDKLATASFSNAFESVGSGTLTISFGSYDATGNTFTANADQPTTSITIDSTNNTLAGIRDAINAADAGVTASIVGDASGQRLVIAGDDSGAANAIKIAVADSDGNSTDASGLSQLAWDPTAAAGSGANLSHVVSAQDAKFSVDGLALTSASNVVGSAVTGLTLTLKQTTSSATTVTIERDDNQVVDALGAFVDAYNSVASAVQSASGYDSEQKKGAPLIGDSTILAVSHRLRGLLTSTLASSSNSSYNSLKSVGISLQKDGTLTLDTEALTTALNSNADAVAGLFLAAGTATDSRVNVALSTSETKAGTYAVNVSAEASRGLMTGSALGSSAPFTIDSSNDSLTLSVDGVSSNAITLTQGSYASGADLAAQLQTRINGDAKFKASGVGVSVSWDNDHLVITSNRYGSASKVTAASGTAASAFGLSGASSTTGTDIAGSIGGVAATGSGRALIGTGDAAGLRLDISGSGTGDRGSVTFTRGFGDLFSSLLDDMLASDGAIQLKSDALSAEGTRIEDQRTALEDRMTTLEERYRKQFERLDVVMAQLQATSNYLTQQLDAWTSSSSSSS